MIEIRQYVDRQGRNTFERWFLALDVSIRARIATALGRLENGNFSASRSVGAGVFEQRLDFGPGYRIYFGRDGETIIILLGGGTKKRQQSDIQMAHILWREYRQEKREE